MNFYAHLKIGSKLILGFAVVVFMALTIGIFGYYQIHSLTTSNDFLIAKGVKPLEHIGDIATDFQRLRVNIWQLILANGKKNNEYYEERVVTFRAEITAETKKLEAALPDDEARKLYALLVKARTDYTPHIQRIIELARHAKTTEAMAYLQSDAVIAVEHAEIAAIENLQEYLIQNSQKIAVRNSAASATTGKIMLWLAFGVSLLAALLAFLITRSIVNPLQQVLDAVHSLQDGSRKKAQLVEAISNGDLDKPVVVTEPLRIDLDSVGNDEAGMLLKGIIEMSKVQYILDHGFAEMTSSLRHNRDQELLRDWFKSGHNELNIILRGDKSTAELTEQALEFLTEYLHAGVGAFYVFDENEAALQMTASYGCTRSKRMKDRIELGEGLAGQAALEKKMICLNNAPPEYLSISSGIGSAEPINILVMPLQYNDRLAGLLEIGSFTAFSDHDLEFMNQCTESVAIALNVNKSRRLVNELLEQAQAQSEELRVQQEELQQSNEELEERAQMLEQQREQIRAKNREVEETSHELRRKADELEKVSTYKSDFLANMSHELRTPLNSLMILSSLLKDNREGNLTSKQVEFAATINGAGRDLLNLINDILDLSKIESGHLEFHYSDLELRELCEQLEKTFTPISTDKGIAFTITRQESAPDIIIADGLRTQQILKNLISNACKFTSQGSVSVRVYAPTAAENPLDTQTVAFSVTDTGIGIPPDKQSLIFNAFQQADGSTSRTYGGTGLGLSISRQLARTMGGEVLVRSEAGVGSTFTLYLPVRASCSLVRPDLSTPSAPAAPARQSDPSSQVKNGEQIPAPIPDDRDTITAGSRSILIIEDDLTFASVLCDLVRGRGFNALVAADGENGILMAERYQPNAVILDVMLPHIDGWGVMRSLKDNPHTRHIPVHFITCLEERQKAMGMGAIGYVTKPVSSEQLDSVFSTLESAIEKTMKMLLIVEDDQTQATALVALLAERNVTIKVAESGDKAIKLLSTEQFDCIVLDLGLADMGAFELLEELKRLDPERRIPVIIHTGRELTHEDEKQLHHYAESIIIKGAKSPERLLNEVTLFLHLVESSLDPGKQRMIRAALDKEAMLEGRKVLIVDDDMRNIFSLSSALSEKNMVIHEAENGREALQQLDEHPDIDLVLMDIMMPEMDGFEAMRAIRKDPRFHDLPIIALTAKAMKGDRDECLKAGASDYIPKPVDMEKLLSLLRVWLYSTTAHESVEIV